MKVIFNLVLLIVLTLTTVNSFAQQEITLTATAANTVVSRVLINDPGLTNNPSAIIVATPIGNTPTLNPHPIGAWYYNNKWWIHNTDNAAIPIGSSFKVQVFLTPDANHFLRIITESDGGGSLICIDSPVLNNNPTSRIKILQNHSPDTRPFRIYPHDVEAIWADRKWCITNKDNYPFEANTAFNVVVTYGGDDPNAPKPPTPLDKATAPTTKSAVPETPKALPIGPAGGDLGGTYPDPTVQKLLGRPLSNTAPTVGQLLRWSGTEWEPVTFSAGGGLSLQGTTFDARNGVSMWNANQLAGREIATTPPKAGQVLKFGSDGYWAPADINGSTAPTAPMQTFFKSGNNTTDWVTNVEYELVDLRQNINLTKRSRLVISAAAQINRDEVCTINCAQIYADFSVSFSHNNFEGFRSRVAAPIRTTATISGYMIDLDPGSYVVYFKLLNYYGTTRSEWKRFSSIMVIPLE